MVSPITARQKVEKQIAELAKSGTDEAEAYTGEQDMRSAFSDRYEHRHYPHRLHH